MKIYPILVATLLLSACNASGRNHAPYKTDANKAVPGTYVVVPGDTVSAIAERTNVAVLSIIELNHLEPPFLIYPGQVLKISGETQPDAAPVGSVAVKKLPPPSKNTGQKQIAASPQIQSSSQANNSGEFRPVPRPLGSAPLANSSSPSANESPTPQTPGSSFPVASSDRPKSTPQSQYLSEPGANSPSETAKNQPRPVNPTTQNQEPITAEIPSKSAIPAASASSNATPSAPAPTPTPTPTTAPIAAPAPVNNEAPISVPVAAPVEEVASLPDNNNNAKSALPSVGNNKALFAWPVKGQIIGKFGPDSQGLKNDGINIAAPLGSPVRAAGDGVVAYAGNELRGFGNLVLVKHADGWITAYAHNETLMVKKGDNVKKGQQIAKVGQTGNVNSPQLHFEIRKGAQAVDPLPRLNG